MSFSKFQMGAAAATLAVGLSAGAAFADATVTVCTGPGGTDCATDTIRLNRGKRISECVDGHRVKQGVSSAYGERSFNDALTGLYNIALRTAEAVERDGVSVTGFRAEMSGCTGSWSRHCTDVTVGQVNTEGVKVPNPNSIIETLTGQEANSCRGSNTIYRIQPIPGQ